MTTSEELEALQRIADRSFGGRSMSCSSMIEDGIEDATVRDLEAVGLIEVRDHDGDPTASLTDAGLRALRP